MGFFDKKKDRKQPEFTISPDMSPKDLRQAVVEYAQLHSKWYENQARKMSNSWNYITFSTIVLSAISSVLAAYDLGSDYRWLPAGLSAAAGLCAAYLTQFRVRDLWQIRETGRIAAEKLVAKAQAVDVSDQSSIYASTIALRVELHNLEQEQTDQFFAVPKA
ncbi:DUF4231 domain-containing protein [Shinella sp.]|uniref:DUF4231 domain-containing protein n=1 Tax=Shinella sp. TaxID=1870904 RepID=UPI003F71E250